MTHLFLQGPDVRPRTGLRTALVVVGAAISVGSFAAVTLLGAPRGDVVGATRSQVRALEGEIQRIDARAASAADAHAAAVRRSDGLRARIAATTRDLAEARRARAVAVERLARRIVGLYRQEPPSLVEILLTSGDLTAAVDAQATLEAVGDQDRRIVDQITSTRFRLTRLKADLVADREGVEASVTESAARLEELEGLIATRRRVLDDAQATLDGLIARRADRTAARAEVAAERALRRRAEPAATPIEAVAATPTAAGGGVSAALARIADCESGGNPRAVSASGQYRGKYQFDRGTWEALGGSGDPAAAPEAEQDRIAALLYSRSGPAPWPVCGYR
jgi:septal ring factor EnvC (AmiA/AmiB activator)